MPTFSYRARDKDGMLVTGDIEALSSAELKESLFRSGMIPLEVVEKRTGTLQLESLVQIFSRVKPEELIIFTRQFYTLFKAGVSMDTILSTIVKQVSSKPLANALTRIRADVGSGATLAQAFGRHPRIFDELYVSMLSAGEEAGILEQVLKNLSDLLERDYEVQKNVKGAILYPKILITVLVLAMSFLMVFVVPKFVDFYGRYGAELPLPTRILITTSNVFRNYWYILLTAVVVGFYVSRQFYQSSIGRFKVDRLKFRLPVFGNLNLKVANSRFCHIIAALYSSGMAMPRGLEVASNVIGNVAFGQEIQKVKDGIQQGLSLSEAMGRQTYFPPLVVETAAIGEKAGALGDMFSTIAEHYDLEISHLVKNLTTLLEPILLVGIFAMVALLALGIFLPVWNLSAVVTGR